MSFESHGFSHEVVLKGERALGRGLVARDEDHPNDIFWVTSSNGQKSYRVQVGQDGSFVTCTCPHGLHAGGGMTKCYHAAAALLLLDLEAKGGKVKVRDGS